MNVRPSNTHRLRALPALLLLLGMGLPGPAAGEIIDIPASFRAGPPRGSGGDGLAVRFKDTDGGCSIAFIKEATDTVVVQTTTMANVNFLLNQGCTFGPFNHGCGYFQTRWDSFLDIRAAGDYVFSMQVDDQAEIAIGDSVILFLEGGHWFENVTSDTVRFAVAGSYPLRIYYADCQPCCRGFRLAGMGPAGSGMMGFIEGFDFNTDLGPCCTFGTNGPGVSIIPADLFFLSPPSVAVEPGIRTATTEAILGSWTSPNPSRGTVLLSVELAREQSLWVEVFDASGRRLGTLAAGDRYSAGVVSWPWSPLWAQPARPASGTYFYRVRNEDGASAGGRFTILR